MRRKGKRQGDAVPLNPLPKGMIPFGILGKCTDLDLGAAVPGGGPGAASGFGGDWMPGMGIYGAAREAVGAAQRKSSTVRLNASGFSRATK